MMRWLLPTGLVVALAGYFAPWVAHPAAGLVITGLDLGEYVKFLPAVRDGSIWLWRPGFYAPLIAVAAAALLVAYRADMAYPWWTRSVLLALAVIAALNLVPPAWTPARLLELEFRFQTTSLLLLLTATAISPFLALLPWRVVRLFVTLLALLGIATPLFGFFQVLPAIEELYNQPLTAAWGAWLMLLGLLLAVAAYWRLPAKTGR